MKRFSFLTGLPRSGSTVLASILSQNPKIYTSSNSPLVELLVNIRNHLRISEQARAFLEPTQEKDVLLAIMEGMYRFSKASHVLDKSRVWVQPENIKLLSDILPHKPKFIATVRDLPAILTSFIARIEAQPERVSYIDRHLQEKGLPPTTENRCELLFSPGGPVWEAWFTLKRGLEAGYGGLIHLIEYDDLVSQPHETLKAAQHFLGLPAHAYDLTRIRNKTPEDDSVYNIAGFHEVRPLLRKTSKDPAAVLGKELVERYNAVPHFWRKEPVKKSQSNPFNLL